MLIKHLNISLVLFVLSMSFVTPSWASEFSQPGFYDVQHYVLDNGLRVILKPRHFARNVSIRLNVNVGHEHFICGKRETAHFLEHLLFTGTTQHDENELDEIIESHGGTWNAETGADYTVYKIDIFNKYLDVGVNLLNEIITDSVISKENVETSRNIINREAEGKPSALRNWLHKKGIVASATHLAAKDLFPRGRNICDEIDNSSSVTRDEIISTYANYYVPNNMTLSIVGDFEIDIAKNLIANSLGKMKRVEDNKRSVIPVPDINENLDPTKIYKGQFSPLLDTDATVYQFYRIPDKHHKDKFIFKVLEEYFNREMYKLLRVEKGLAYSPGAVAGIYNKFGLFLLSSDSEIDNVDTNLKLMGDIIEKFKKGDLDTKTLEETKLKILLNAARGYETNAGFSDYYVSNYFEIKEQGELLNYEENIKKVTLADIQRVSLKYFTEDNRVIAVTSPTLTYTQFYIIMFAVIGMITFLVWRVVLHLRKKNKNKRNFEYLSL